MTTSTSVARPSPSSCASRSTVAFISSLRSTTFSWKLCGWLSRSSSTIISKSIVSCLLGSTSMSVMRFIQLASRIARAQQLAMQQAKSTPWRSHHASSCQASSSSLASGPSSSLPNSELPASELLSISMVLAAPASSAGAEPGRAAECASAVDMVVVLPSAGGLTGGLVGPVRGFLRAARMLVGKCTR